MIPDELDSQEEEQPILSVIQKIKDGLLEPKALPKETRQQCVEALTGEGYSEQQIAQILNRSEKTIQRDLKDIRARNALTPDMAMAKEIIGDMFKKALSHHNHLIRIAHNKDTSDENRIQAEFSAWRILREMVCAMQSLGYLPLKPQEFSGDIYHHQDDEMKSLDELKSELTTIEKVAKESGSLDESTKGHIKLIQQKLEQVQIAKEIVDLARKNSDDQVAFNKEG